MLDNKDKSLRLMTKDELSVVLEWRNTPAVRNSMFSMEEITLQQHQQWFENVNNTSEFSLLILELDGKPAGFVNIKQISEGKIADWSFYAAPDSKKGTGYVLCKMAVDYAFKELKMEKLNGQVISFNERSIAVHKRLGFKQEGVLRSNYFRNNNYYDVYLLGMTVEEWASNNDKH
jgi:UDP-4-amino-4,6-dideoxy-N-acetyl-beta-L-altrosamine N-acetyltransferase